MPVPLKAGDLQGAVLHDEDGTPIDAITSGGLRRLAVDAVAVLPALSSVAINDAGAGVTELSVKLDGIAVTAGSALVGGIDGSGDQQALKTSTTGRLEVTDENAALLGSLSLVNAEETVEVADTDIFPSDGTAPRDGFIDIEFVGSLAGVWSLKLIRAATTRVAELKDGASVVADRWQVFSFPVKAADDVNLRVSAGMTVTAMISFRDK